jgi:hypothetical protein
MRDAAELERFTTICQAGARKVTVNIDPPSFNGQKTIQVKLSPIFDIIAKELGVACGVSSWLYCYDTLSGELLFHQKIETGRRYFDTNIPIPPHVSPADVKSCLFSACVGLDSMEAPSSSAHRPQQQSKARPRTQKKAQVQTTIKQAISRSPVRSASTNAPKSVLDATFHAMNSISAPLPEQGTFRRFEYSDGTAAHQHEFNEMLKAEAEAESASRPRPRPQSPPPPRPQAQVQMQRRTTEQAQAQLRRRQELQLTGGFGTVKRLRSGEVTSVGVSPLEHQYAGVVPSQELADPTLPVAPQQAPFFISQQLPPSQEQQQQQQQYYYEGQHVPRAAVAHVSPELPKAASYTQIPKKIVQQPKIDDQVSKFDDQFF